jgi:predicted dehydrogenase
MTTIGIIGGGNGGTTILGAFHEIEDFKVVGCVMLMLEHRNEISQGTRCSCLSGFR